MATASLCKTAVFKIYQEIIEDVIHNVRELFIEDGVDEQVLQELKQTWETKVLASRAVDTDLEIQTKQALRKAEAASNGSSSSSFSTQQQVQGIKQVVGQVPPNNHVQTSLAQVVENKLVPIQITLPSQPGSDVGHRVLTIQVPASALHGNQLHKVLTGPVITATMSLPQSLACSVLQQHVNAALNSQQPTLALSSIINKPIMQSDGNIDDIDDVTETNAGCSTVLDKSNSSKQFVGLQNLKLKYSKKIDSLSQIDGPNDTSDEEEEASEDEEASDEIEEDKDEEEQEMEETGPEEEPLNSEDDVSDEDPSDLFDTDNVIVCQYDKITRSRNKWKFHFKDGIMNLDGEDYVFQKANGDAEW